jgi:hypothetical protein
MLKYLGWELVDVADEGEAWRTWGEASIFEVIAGDRVGEEDDEKVW